MVRAPAQGELTSRRSRIAGARTRSLARHVPGLHCAEELEEGDGASGRTCNVREQQLGKRPRQLGRARLGEPPQEQEQDVAPVRLQGGPGSTEPPRRRCLGPLEALDLSFFKARAQRTGACAA